MHILALALILPAAYSSFLFKARALKNDYSHFKALDLSTSSLKAQLDVYAKDAQKEQDECPNAQDYQLITIVYNIVSQSGLSPHNIRLQQYNNEMSCAAISPAEKILYFHNQNFYKQCPSLEAQQFVITHELGHKVYNGSYNKIMSLVVLPFIVEGALGLVSYCTKNSDFYNPLLFSSTNKSYPIVLVDTFSLIAARWFMVMLFYHLNGVYQEMKSDIWAAKHLRSIQGAIEFFTQCSLANNTSPTQGVITSQKSWCSRYLATRAWLKTIQEINFYAWLHPSNKERIAYLQKLKKNNYESVSLFFDILEKLL